MVCPAWGYKGLWIDTINCDGWIAAGASGSWPGSALPIGSRPSWEITWNIFGQGSVFQQQYKHLCTSK